MCTCQKFGPQKYFNDIQGKAKSRAVRYLQRWQETFWLKAPEPWNSKYLEGRKIRNFRGDEIIYYEILEAVAVVEGHAGDEHLTKRIQNGLK